MSDTGIESAICLAINILTNKKIGLASFDKTIRATVIGKGNDGALSYRVKGEGTSLMLVYSNSPDIDYPIGSIVYVLIPAGNTDRDKYIVGSGAKLVNQYKDIINTSNVNYIGQDLITRCGLYSLNSYKKDGDELILYPSDENNHFYVDNSIGLLSINLAQTIQLSSNIRTAFSDTQVGGTYGVEIVLKFQYKNKDTEDVVLNIKTYVLNQEDVIGNPFRQRTGQKVSAIFDIVGEGTFVSVEKVRLFIKDFPDNEEKTGLEYNDIFFSNLSLIAVDVPDREVLSGYLAVFDFRLTGSQLSKDLENLDGHKYVVAHVDFKLRGLVQKPNSDFKYYWFIEDASITQSVEGYHSYAGRGWRCLNPKTGTGTYTPLKSLFLFTYLDLKNIDSLLDENVKKIIKQYNAENSALLIRTKTIRIKCYVQRGLDLAIATKPAIIYNNAEYDYDIYIDSSDKLYDENRTIYYWGHGSPNLTCKVKSLKEESSTGTNKEFIYSWMIRDNKNNVSYPLQKKDYFNEDVLLTLDEIDNYFKNKSQILESVNSVVGDNAEGQRDAYLKKLKELYKEQQYDFETLSTYLNSLSSDLFVVLNTIYNVDILNIHVLSTYVCSVSIKLNGNVIYLGSASITLKNLMKISDGHQLFLLNGIQVFHYNEDGLSPTSTALEKPLLIKPITFVWITSDGTLIRASLLLSEGTGKCRWYLPAKNTFLQFSLTDEEKKNLDETENYYIIENRNSILYSIIDNYDNKLKNNNIKVHVECQNGTLDAYTDFTFAKDGDPGTNGTIYTSKIVSNNEYATDRLYGMIYDGKSLVYDDLGNSVSKLQFRLYENGVVKKFNLNDTGFKWEVLHNIKKSESVNSNINDITSKKSLTDIEVKSSSQQTFNNPYDIVRGSYVYNGFTHYAEFPINYVSCPTNYRIKIAPKTGFKYVTYTSDGRTPAYDNTLPFKVVLLRLVQGGDVSSPVSYWQEISQYNGKKIFYKCLSLPKSLLFSFLTNEYQLSNEFVVVPNDKFDGLILNAALLFTLKTDLVGLFAKIHVPIYMNLNRYGLSALNAWDGNTAQVNEGNIMAPQIGAGKKDENNTFTGVMMGKVKLDSPNTLGDIELIGLFAYDQGARTVFIDSKRGKAEFGKNNSGKIVIDPSKLINLKDGATAAAALLYSNGFRLEDEKTEDNKIIKGYLSNTPNAVGRDSKGNIQTYGSGLLIDLTSPAIIYGSGRFSVDSDGNLIAQGGGLIAGWNIGVEDLSSPKSKKTVVAEDGTLSESEELYTPLKLGIKLIVYKDKYAQDLFKVSSDGSANIAGWNFDNEKLSKGKIKISSNDGIIVYSNDNDTKPSFEANTNGITQIGSWIVKSNQINSGGSDPSIVLQPNGTVFKGNTTIGGWKVDSTSIKSIEGENPPLGQKYQISINSNGSITANNDASDTGWSINRDGTASFKQINATGGTIGGITIANDQISGSGFILGPYGCHFTGLTVTNNGVGYGSVGGYSNGGSSSGGTSGGNSPLARFGGGSPYISPKMKTGPNGETWELFINIKVDKIDVESLFIYQGKKGAWAGQSFVSRISLSQDKRFINVTYKNVITLVTEDYPGRLVGGASLGPIGGTS